MHSVIVMLLISITAHVVRSFTIMDYQNGHLCESWGGGIFFKKGWPRICTVRELCGLGTAKLCSICWGRSLAQMLIIRFANTL